MFDRCVFKKLASVHAKVKFWMAEFFCSELTCEGEGQSGESAGGQMRHIFIILVSRADGGHPRLRKFLSMYFNLRRKKFIPTRYKLDTNTDCA